MSDPRTQYEREEDELCDDLNEGRITRKEFDAAMRAMRDEIRAQAEDAAREAYDDVMGRY
jgi:predicted RNA-binding protein associated with RNAse of E/G family